MTPRRCLALLVALAALAPARAQDKALDLKPTWKKGDTARYEMTKTQTRENDGKIVRKVATRTPVELEVLNADADGSGVRWAQGTTTFEDPKYDDDPGLRALNAILKSMDIDLELDATGTFTGLRNWKELRGTGHKIQETVLAQMQKTGTSKATIDYLRKETDKLFASKEAIEASFSRQAALLVLPYGTKFEVGKVVEYEASLPNVLGGDEPFPAKGTFVLKALDSDAKTATIVYKQTPDPKELNRVLRKWLEELATKTGKPAPKDLPDLDLTDTIEYEFDLATGWVKTVTHTLVAKQPGTTQIDVVTLTRKSR
jgi:hypothetical protein